ncbi:IstB domain protein ATP-binding protein [Desulfofarcimen acetoxidans DSM 771]|uniref:IstB domain protein ATP-binding protein n=1 Tax=Desulfofarcimen acetoxidans (strain ATCC 49208 / DSM 771 / KCTC 5769 / VKM B-1644 / 5575) TaxID=485916 RepID=C8VZE2_DESAS|nr:ATP-binding protein [Desulfofarcimen acetoxidans]ACV64887.1 IstB domain protein ATP-binding protein [Desulfofarcimen acetoxidans DSM 771]
MQNVAEVVELQSKKQTMQTTTMPIVGTCPFSECDGSGRIIYDEDGIRYFQKCKCRELAERRHKIEELFSIAKIPRRFASKTFENYIPRNEEQEKALYLSRRYVDKFETLKNEGKNGLYIVGPTGTGKTHLAYAIISQLIQTHMVSVVSCIVPELMDTLRPQNNRNEAEERFRLIKNTELVLLDDLGAEKESEWVVERLLVIINARYSNMVPTIITSNIPLDLLSVDKDRNLILDWQRIVSRIREMCHLVLVDGDDYRVCVR